MAVQLYTVYCKACMLIKYSLKDPAIIFSPKRRSWTGSNALCCRVIVEKNPLPIWPEFVRRLGLSLLHPAEERGWEHSAKLQQQNPIHPSYFPVMLSGPPAFLFAVCIRASMQCNVSFPLYLPPREHPQPFLYSLPTLPQPHPACGQCSVRETVSKQ